MLIWLHSPGKRSHSTTTATLTSVAQSSFGSMTRINRFAIVFNSNSTLSEKSVFRGENANLKWAINLPELRVTKSTYTRKRWPQQKHSGNSKFNLLFQLWGENNRLTCARMLPEVTTREQNKNLILTADCTQSQEPITRVRQTVKHSTGHLPVEFKLPFA